MTKRGNWVMCCLVFAAMWGVFGLIIWPFLFLSMISVMMIMIPVGKPEGPTHVHNPNEWNRRG